MINYDQLNRTETCQVNGVTYFNARDIIKGLGFSYPRKVWEGIDAPVEITKPYPDGIHTEKYITTAQCLSLARLVG